MSAIMVNVFTSGVMVFLGMLLVFIKLRPRRMLWLLGHALWLDLGITILTYAMHYGTFTGVMAATVAGLLTSVFTTLAILLVGKVVGNTYFPGYFDIRNKL